jgi:hypothetical protein
MRKMGIGVLVALALVFALMFAARELGGEVVTLTTLDGDGTRHETSLWIVEDDGSLWLRAGNSGSSWLTRLTLEPRVEVSRAGETASYRAEIVPERSQRIDEKMADDYGWADSLIGGMRDSGGTTAIRLVRVDR